MGGGEAKNHFPVCSFFSGFFETARTWRNVLFTLSFMNSGEVVISIHERNEG